MHWPDTMQIGATDAWTERNRVQLEAPTPMSLSLVELVVTASELTEDETELADLIGGLLDSGSVEVESLCGL